MVGRRRRRRANIKNNACLLGSAIFPGTIPASYQKNEYSRLHFPTEMYKVLYIAFDYLFENYILGSSPFFNFGNICPYRHNLTRSPIARDSMLTYWWATVCVQHRLNVSYFWGGGGICHGVVLAAMRTHLN